MQSSYFAGYNTIVITQKEQYHSAMTDLARLLDWSTTQLLL